MVESRLHSREPALARRLVGASPEVQRGIAGEVARMAIATFLPGDNRLDEGFRALEEGRFGDADVLMRVQRVVDELDQFYWRAEEGKEAGGADTTEGAFAQARSSSALLYALESSAVEAVLDAVYEAGLAFEDIDAARIPTRVADLLSA